jgi:ferredoxin
MRVYIDDERCRGHGMCCALHPQLFQLTDDGYAIVLLTEVPSELHGVVGTAVDQCPERAISITE